MENSLSSKIQLLLDNEVEFPQQLKQHLVFKSDQVSNPFKFITGLLSKGVLCDGSNESDATLEVKEAMVRLAMIIACGKGADGISGLVEALEESGNVQITCDFRAWLKQNFAVEIESTLGEPKGNEATAQSKPSNVLTAQTSSIKETSSCGTKLINKITSRVEHGFLEQLQGYLVGKASEIANVTEFCASLVHQNVLDETEVQLATDSGIHGEQEVKKIIKATLSKRATESLVVALESNKNEKIIMETLDWLETSKARQNYHPISVKSLARERGPTGTGLFAATSKGLISLNLRTLEATYLTTNSSFAVAVNEKLSKVYWTEGHGNSTITRSNFDGSAKEEIVPPAGGHIITMAIDERSGNVYFPVFNSHEIKVCNSRGENLTVVLSNSSLIKYVRSIALDSVKGLMFWTKEAPRYHASLVCANLDGSNPAIVSTGCLSVHNITLDRSSNDVLYWADNEKCTIGSMDFNGGNILTLVKLAGIARPNRMQVDAQNIYFSNNYTTKTIQSVDRASGQELTTIFKTTGLKTDLARFNAPTK